MERTYSRIRQIAARMPGLKALTSVSPTVVANQTYVKFLQARNSPATRSSGSNWTSTGSIFPLTPASAVSPVAVFDGHNNVAGIPRIDRSSRCLAQALDGDLCGVTNQKTLRPTLNSKVTNFHTFDPSTKGSGPASLFQAGDGNLYGMTDAPRDVVGSGVLFRIGLDGSHQQLSALNAAAIGFRSDISHTCDRCIPNWSIDPHFSKFSWRTL